MRLSDRVARLRWMAIPIAAYLMITLGLPAAHGAGARAAFGHHLGRVLAGCAVVFGLAVLGSVALDAVRRGARLIRGGRP
jgi:hypothetical protein